MLLILAAWIGSATQVSHWGGSETYAAERITTPDLVERLIHDEHQELRSYMWAGDRPGFRIAPGVVLGSEAVAGVYGEGVLRPGRQLDSQTLASSQLQALICSYEWSCGTALRIAWGESKWDPLAVGSLGERGLFQIHPVHAWRFDSWADAFVPAENVRVAHEIWLDQGWGPWSCA